METEISPSIIEASKMLASMMWDMPTMVVSCGQGDNEGPDYQERAITIIDVFAVYNSPFVNIYKADDVNAVAVFTAMKLNWSGKNPFASWEQIAAAESTRVIFAGLDIYGKDGEPDRGGAWYLYYEI
ncbi:MAG: hypothetical protein LIP09_14120 [Bacteroidales bacterium]|nr:hypothetical protein [Bacteroidales bacterium]MCC8119865.1 hypothetical protein [Bacteroidales bacterium]